VGSQARKLLKIVKGILGPGFLAKGAFLVKASLAFTVPPSFGAANFLY